MTADESWLLPCLPDPAEARNPDPAWLRDLKSVLRAPSASVPPESSQELTTFLYLGSHSDDLEIKPDGSEYLQLNIESLIWLVGRFQRAPDSGLMRLDAIFNWGTASGGTAAWLESVEIDA